MQIIRAGNGISHSEFIAKDGEIFQIWFDPNLSKTLQQPASYDDYRDSDFPETSSAGVRVKTLVGPGSPFRMETPGVSVHQIDLDAASHTQPAESGTILSAYVLEGEVMFNGELARTQDFVQVSGEAAVEMRSLAGARVFAITSPQEIGRAHV